MNNGKEPISSRRGILSKIALAMVNRSLVRTPRWRVFGAKLVLGLNSHPVNWSVLFSQFCDRACVGLKTHEIGGVATALAQWCTSGFAQAGD